jgi:hypothetical protein
MSNTSTYPIASTAAPASGLVCLIPIGLLVAPVVYVAATTALLPHVVDASAAIDLLVAAVLPGLLVIPLLRALRPAAYRRRRGRAFVAVVLLSAAASASVPPILFAAA